MLEIKELKEDDKPFELIKNYNEKAGYYRFLTNSLVEIAQNLIKDNPNGCMTKTVDAIVVTAEYCEKQAFHYHKLARNIGDLLKETLSNE